MTIRTVEQLDAALAEDLIWRKKEMSAYRLLTEASQGEPERHRALLRGSIALLYAHWEGYVRTAALAYLEFVAFQRLRYDELSHNFIALGARKLLKAAETTSRIRSHIALIEFATTGLGARSNIPYRDGIRTDANLSSTVLREITDTLGLDYSLYESKEKLIDESLLARRNRIAHGEYLSVDMTDYRTLSVHILEMLELFKSQVTNAAALGEYRSAA